MVDKVKPLKFEDSSSGTQIDFAPKEANPNEDYLTGKGVAFENNDDFLIDVNSNEIQFTDTVNGTKKVSDLLDSDQEDFDPTGTTLSSTKTGPAIRELANSLTTNEYAIFSIWAEENAGLSNGAKEWSFGNGAAGENGIVLPVDAELFAVSYNTNNAGVNSEVAVLLNNTTQIGTTGSQSGQDGFNTLTSPVSVSAGDRIGFQTVIGGGASNARVCAWFRVPITTLLNVGLNDLNDVNITTLSSGQFLSYNGSEWVNVAAPSAPVDSVNGQTGVVVLDADDIDDSTTTNKFATQAELDQIATNQTNIATNASDIATNTSNIATNTSNIATNTSDISTNQTNISTNTSNISTNQTNITTNASDISTLENRNINTTTPLQGGGDLSSDRTISLNINAATSATPAGADEILIADVSDSNNIKKTTLSSIVSLVPSAPVDSVNGQTGVVVLDADDIDDSTTTNKFATQAELDQIATNQTNISTNTASITTNTASINTNAASITTNASAINNNATNISTNSSNIANNTASIITNTASIITNTASITTNASNISTNAASITTNASNISTNASAITTNASDISELELNQDDLITLSGVPENNTNLGTFTGTTIPDNQNNKQAFQSLETGLETHVNDTTNPHNTTFTQAVAADAGTDITASEAEELTNGSTISLHNHRELVDETATNRVEVLNGGDVQLSNYLQTRNDTTSNDEKVLTTNNSGNLVLRRVLPFYDSIKKISNSTTEAGINQTTTFQTYLELTTTIPETGNYDIDWRYVWSLNSGARDFVSQILLDGSPISTFNQHIQEPKDAAGTGITLLTTTGTTTDTGTNQRHRLSDFEPEVNLTAGSHTITIQWACAQANDEATIYEGAIRIKRVS